MKLAVMQPYFFPYIGYFQLIAAADVFIVYDNLKYTKKGWINRNRILENGQEASLSLPLKGGSDSLDICQREVAADFNALKILNRLKGAYRKAPFFAATYPMIEEVLGQSERNLFHFLHNGLVRVCRHLGLDTDIRVSSSAGIDHTLKGQDKVLAFCENAAATTYVNAIGGMELYGREAFAAHGVDLRFVRPQPFAYRQFDNEFVPWLSIIDVLMFNSVDEVRTRVTSNYELI